MKVKSIVIAVSAAIGIIFGFNEVDLVDNLSVIDPYTHVAQIDSNDWDPPTFEERQQERDQLADVLENEGISDTNVLDAIRAVPRHLFIPGKKTNVAYENIPVPIGYGQTISQPYIVGYMTEFLELTESDKVLEIGTGSGYQAAILAHITPYVYSIEIIDELARQASTRFDSLGYSVIKTKAADGYHGWKKHAPFDAIIVTAAAGHIPPPLVKQLKPGGRMIIPIGSPYDVQRMVLVQKDKEGKLDTNRLIPVRFVPMTGAVQEQ